MVKIYIHIYNSTPTLAGTDGTLVSEILPFTGSMTAGSETIANLSINTVNLATGLVITGSGIPSGATIASIVDSATITISANAVLTHANILMVVGNLITTNLLNASINQVSTAIKLAVRTDAGYQSVSGTNTLITPVAAISFTGTTTLSSNVITAINISTAELGVGQYILGVGIPADTIIMGIINGSSIQISNNATAAGTGVAFTQGDPSKWALAPDNAGVPGTWEAYGASLTISSQIAPTNTIFWAEAKATADESPINDISIALQTSAQIQQI